MAEPDDPPWDPCEMCLQKKETKGSELNDQKEEKEKRKEEGEEREEDDNLPDDVDYCEKCDFSCQTCGCRFELLTSWFEDNRLNVIRFDVINLLGILLSILILHISHFTTPCQIIIFKNSNLKIRDRASVPTSLRSEYMHKIIIK